MRISDWSSDVCSSDLFNAKPLGGPGLETLAEVPYQVWLQLEGVLITIVWSAVVAWVAYFIADKVCGLRVSADVEREGLDISTHGETEIGRASWRERECQYV